MSVLVFLYSLLQPRHWNIIARIPCDLEEECLKDIPTEFIPEFRIVDNFDNFYYEGMYLQVVYNKEF